LRVRSGVPPADPVAVPGRSERISLLRIVGEMNDYVDELLPPQRLIMTPGPASLDPRVYRALAAPIVGHMDPFFIGLMGEVQTLLRRAFQTENRVTFPISASGSGGIEASVVNPLEPNDEAIVCVNGTFSDRLAIIAERACATVHRVEVPMGRAVDPQDVLRAGKGRKIKLVGVCHGETSSGVITQIDGFRKVADELGALLVVDAVSTLGGVPINVDEQRIDICFSGTQKAISAPPGMAPITVNPRTEEVLRRRKTPVQSWYFDLTTTMNFWGKDRTYHHTPPISIVYALREALRILFEEGLEASWRRHRQNQQALIAGLEALGLKMFVPNAQDRLPTVTAVQVPGGVDDARTRHQLLEEFGIEIAGGIGALKGRIWRIGLMGYVSQMKHVLMFLAGLEKVLLEQGFRASGGAGVGAALHVYAQLEAVTTAPHK
jgi:alanine-glyoxylate transaminase/serine-glyoxylate transaminase/serine-pyruvate transaminase